MSKDVVQVVDLEDGNHSLEGQVDLPNNGNSSLEAETSNQATAAATSASTSHTTDDQISTSKSKYSGHFVYIKTEDKFKCKHCKKLYKMNKASSTSNMGRHLKDKHADVYSKLCPEAHGQIPKITQAEAAQKLFAKASNEVFTQSEFEKRLVKFIVVNDQPFSIVESSEFQRLFAFKNHDVTFPGRNGIKSRITASFEQHKIRISKMLKESTGKISIVLDCWTSSSQVAYHGIIARWVNNDWELREEILDLDMLEGRHVGDTLAKSFLKVLFEYELQDKMLGVTTDNASNCDTFFEALAKYLAEKGVSFKESDQRVRCLAHIINLACQDALECLKFIAASVEEIESDFESDGHAEVTSKDSIYARLRSAVTKIRKSVRLKETYKKQCDVSGLKYRELTLDVKTRWNSSFFMLKRAFKQQVALDNTLRVEELGYLRLDESEWKKIKIIVEFLKPFQKVTSLLSSTHGPNMAVSTAAYLELYNHFESYSTSTDYAGVLTEAAEKACTKLNKYFPATDGLVHVIATILDPRTKTALYVDNSNTFPASCRRQYLSTIKTLWTKFYKPALSQDSCSTPPEAKKKKKDTENDFIYTHIKAKGPKRHNRDELQRYLDEPAVEREAISTLGGVLGWWKAHESIYPNLSKMARDYLPVSATGVPIERFFSGGPQLLTPQRRSMSGDTVRICMCLKGWLKSENKAEYRVLQSTLLAEKMLGYERNA